MISMLLQAIMNMAGFLCEVQGFLWSYIYGFLCGIDDVSGPIRLHHLLQV